MQVICNMFKALLETTAALTRFTQKTNYFCYSLCRYLCGVALVHKKNVARTNNTTLIKARKILCKLFKRYNTLPQSLQVMSLVFLDNVIPPHNFFLETI